MKIGILTFHYSINQGSVLQAYCVYKLLKLRFPDAQIEIINLVPFNREFNEWNFVSKRYPFVKFDNIRRYKSLRKFIKENAELSVRRYYRSLKKQIAFINSLNYDYIFTGSDTVWMDSSKLDSILPNIYYLPTQIRAKKVSIAASVDPLKNENQYFEKKHELKKIFKEYSAISVRDNLTDELLKNLGIEYTIKIADPTLLYDFEQDLNIIINKSDEINKQKVYLRIADKKLEGKIKKSLKEYTSFIFNDRDKKSTVKKDFIIEDLNQYADIDILITDRFHRSIFAMKLTNALVINIERFDKNPLQKSKGRDLFENIGIPEYCIRYENNGEEHLIKQIVSCVENWSLDEFKKREEYIEVYKSRNKKVWNILIKKSFN